MKGKGLETDLSPFSAYLNMLKPVKCKVCNAKMQWQLSSDDAVIHCHDCRRAVVVSDWHSNAELFGK